MYKPEIEKFFVGFDTFCNLPPIVQKLDYPRYNIGKYDQGYEIMVALPGYSKDDVTVELHDGVLSVKGVKQEIADIEWLHRGISGKSFDRVFKVDTKLEVITAKLENGMLQISLEYTPSSKPVTIPVE